MITDRQAIEAARALQANGNNKTKAAEALGLARSTFRDRLKVFKTRKLQLQQKVVLVDERVTKVRHRRVSEQEKTDFFKTYGTPYSGPDLIPVHDKRGRKVIDMVGANVILEGRGLEVAMHRAKRWMKNNMGSGKRMPRHIEYGARAMEELSRAA